MLNTEQKKRYARNIALPDIGEKGQSLLLQNRVLIVGAGGLGSAAGLYLAAAGVGYMGLIDSDVVELSNLQRQILHATANINKPKVESGRDAIIALNPDVTMEPRMARLTEDNAGDIISQYDFVIDATDNLPSKFLIADGCHQTATPYSHAGINEFDGQTMTVIPGKTTCYRCVFEALPPEKEPDSAGPPGVLGVLPGVIGSIQATEAIKYILGIGKLLTNRMLVYNALSMSFRTINITINKQCPLCGIK